MSGDPAGVITIQWEIKSVVKSKYMEVVRTLVIIQSYYVCLYVFTNTDKTGFFLQFYKEYQKLSVY